jgi:hypothetical protein
MHSARALLGKQGFAARVPCFAGKQGRAAHTMLGVRHTPCWARGACPNRVCSAGVLRAYLFGRTVDCSVLLLLAARSAHALNFE